MPARWFAVQTSPHAEAKANRHLANQHFTTYLPVYRRRVRHARSSEEVLRPLFPGYLFVHFDPEECRWRSINGTVGVRKILCHGEAPLSVDEKIIAEIKAREDETGAVKLNAPTFISGQAVRVTDGPLADIEGLFEDHRDENRVILLVSLLGRKVRVQVPTATVEVA